MAQQVNLCLPILRKQKTPFTGLALLQAWCILVVLGGALGGAWVWNLSLASTSLNVTLLTQSAELEALRAALTKNQSGTDTAQTAAEKTLASRRAELGQREVVLEALQQGHFQSGFGQAARLQLVAKTIPPEAWVTQITADERSLEVAGFTLEPSVLTTWVNRLAESPLLKGQALSTVKVDQVKTATALPAAVATGAANAPAATQSPKPAMWSFSLLSSMAFPVALVGSKP
jgi:Tfp pilus assembly protein PilN